jgi:hypothetical protein
LLLRLKSSRTQQRCQRANQLKPWLAAGLGRRLDFNPLH